jgi:class 3 adenylate cyclase/pimeloyl-ACP methyl ester carboxylesterase
METLISGFACLRGAQKYWAVERPETQFAWNGASSLAYQVLGEGPPDLLYLPGYTSNVELNWDHPTMARFLRGLARSRRLIVTDPRGLGCSERSTPEDVQPLETMMEDAAVVLDAVESERSAILATYAGTFIACMFAATYPDRTAGIILYGASANYTWSEETPWEYTADQWDQYLQETSKPWTRASALQQVRADEPSMADDRAYVDWWYRYVLLSEALGSAVASTRKFMDTDVRSILPSVHVPAMMLYRPDAHTSDSGRTEAAHYLARQIPGARLKELPGTDGALWIGDQAPLHHAIDSFLADVASERSELDRVVATVLFTDIVGSTQMAVDLGDRAWRELVERHHGAVRALMRRFRGIEIDTAGDGFFASFDGPARAIRCARAIVQEVQHLGIEVRAGLHTGECETIDNKLGGVAVNIGARVGGLARPSEVLVSQTVKDLVAGSGLVFEDRGEHELRGIPDNWRLFAVTN